MPFSQRMVIEQRENIHFFLVASLCGFVMSLGTLQGTGESLDVYILTTQHEMKLSPVSLAQSTRNPLSSCV